MMISSIKKRDYFIKQLPQKARLTNESIILHAQRAPSNDENDLYYTFSSYLRGAIFKLIEKT